MVLDRCDGVAFSHARMMAELADERRKLRRSSNWIYSPESESVTDIYSPRTRRDINNLDDGCLMHIFSFLSPIPDRYNSALVCHRWNFLACHPHLWLRVDRSVTDLSLSRIFPNIETAVSAARPGDTILIADGGSHCVSNIQIRKPLCLIGAGKIPDDTVITCSRGSDSALEFTSTCKLSNLTVRAELGCCLLHRSGKLVIDGCLLQCETNPLDHLSYAIVSTASADSVSVSRTRIEGGSKAVLTSGTLTLQQVRVIYSRTSLLFWFNVGDDGDAAAQSSSGELVVG